jgi:hypothetical protein
MNYTEKYLLEKIESMRKLAGIWMESESHLFRSVAKEIFNILDGKK